MKRFFERFLAIDWIGLPRATVRLWRRSLQFRAASLSVLLTAAAIVGIGVYMSVTISNDLFQSRLTQVLTQSKRAEDAAQRIFDSSVATDRTQVATVVSTALVSIRDASASSQLAFYRSPATQTSALAPQDFVSPDLAGSIISTDLREQVAAGKGAQYWQSVTLGTSAGAVPGVVVGSAVVIPGVGDYELYIAYSFAQSEQTLSFVHQVLWFAGLILLILVGVIAWFIGRVVVGPIKVTASTSKKIASGDLSARVPEVGDDVLAELARNFNDMAQSMQRQVTNLEDLSSMQQRFVSDVSHELKTPLTTIKMASDYLYDKREDFDPGTNQSLVQLHQSVDRFQGLLSDLLEISRYDAGTVRLDLEPTNMVALVNEVVAALGAIASERGSSIEVVAPGGHSDVLVDPRRIRRILTNLVANAIEHGEGRPIVIEVDSNAEAVSVVVDDRGVGMTAEQAAQVFNRFYRADPARPRTIGGTGLGLSISFEDARIHNGRLEVWAAPGEGARFMLTVPRKPSVRWKSAALSATRTGVFDA